VGTPSARSVSQPPNSLHQHGSRWTWPVLVGTVFYRQFMTLRPEPIAPSALPTGVPRRPFTRYVHRPFEQQDPLFPRDGTAQLLRVIIDVGSLSEGLQSDEEFIGTVCRPEVEAFACCLSGEVEDMRVKTWREALRNTGFSEIAFRDLSSTARMLDAATFGVRTIYPPTSTIKESGSRADFFPAFIDADEHCYPAGDIARADRERLAVFSAATRALSAHLLVTGTAGAGRVEVSQNDTLAICEAEGAMAVVGHYLRSIESRIYRSSVDGRRQHLLGSLKDFYGTAVEVNVPVAQVLNMAAATHLSDQRVVTATYTLIARFERALRAVDDLLRYMTQEFDVDTVVELSESLDRELINISAILDICGRMLRDRLNVGGDTRLSLQSAATFEKIINPHYPDAPELARLQELQPMFRFAHEMRNSIHDSILEPHQVELRQYGGAKGVALRLEALPYSCSHADQLGIWRGGSLGLAYADLPTLATGLLRNAMEFVNMFLLMVAIRKPVDAPDAAKSLGAGVLEGGSMPIHEIPHLIGRLFGWQVPQPFARHLV
jgi:hypothetical protein